MQFFLPTLQKNSDFVINCHFWISPISPYSFFFLSGREGSKKRVCIQTNSMQVYNKFVKGMFIKNMQVVHSLLICSPFNPMSKTSAAGRQIFADLDRFLGRHAVLSDSIGRHKHFFSLQIQQTSSTCNKKKVFVFRQTKLFLETDCF